MSDSYFNLKKSDQEDIISTAASNLGRDSSVLEKDVWLTFVLQQIFSTPNNKPMAFKGGTSLSKVHGVIKRFSEDVDITIDYRSLGCDIPLSDLIRRSRNQRAKISAQLKEQVGKYSAQVIRPHLLNELGKLRCGKDCSVEVSDDGEVLKVFYPSLTDQSGYLREFVLVEFGGRNIIQPNAAHLIRPDIAKDFPNVAFPIAANVVVLAAERTFWEKVTLIHAACNKPFSGDLNRNSRHWYDLAMMLRHDCGQRAKFDFDLLKDVIALKSVFFESSSTHYDRCTSGELNLIPDAQNMARLDADYAAMQQAGMLNGHDFPMEQIMAELSTLQAEINTRCAE